MDPSKIKVARKNAMMSQEYLAQKLGINRATLSKYENGQIVPTIEQIEKIAAALGVPIGELLGTIPQIDREYEDVVDVLRSVGFSIEATGYSEGPDDSGDCFYIWHDDAENPEEDRVELVYRDLLQIVQEAQAGAERKKQDYLRKRLETDIF